MIGLQVGSSIMFFQDPILLMSRNLIELILKDSLLYFFGYFAIFIISFMNNSFEIAIEGSKINFSIISSGLKNVSFHTKNIGTIGPYSFKTSECTFGILKFSAYK